MKLIHFALSAILLVVVAVAAVQPTQVSADAKADACAGLQQVNPGASCGQGAGVSSVNNIVKTFVSILSIVVGIVSIIVVIISGLKYITSGGDAQKVSSAKNTLIYAIVGIIIAALAQFLVHFALAQSNNVTPCPSNPAISRGDKACT